MHVNYLSGLLAMAPAPANGASGTSQNPLWSFMPLIALGVIFYFILIRPQQQRTKQQAKMLSALKAGDKVVTAAGIVGVVISVKDKTVTLRSADAKFEVTKASVSDIIPDDTATPSAS